jgi:hypothetical protein
MSTRARNKLQKAQKGKKKPAVFSNNTPRKVVLYNTIPSMPDEFDTVIRAFGKLSSTAIGVSSHQFTVFTNSMLHTADSFTNGSSSNTLSNIGRNYTKYRVVGYRITYTLAGQDTSSYHMLEYHAPVDPAFSAGSTFSNEAVTRDKAAYHFVPSNTQYPNVSTHSSSYKLMQIVGEEEFEQEASYAGALSSSGVPSDPSDLTFLILHFGKVSGAAFNAAVLPDVVLTLTQFVRFYDKRV